MSFWTDKDGDPLPGRIIGSIIGGLLAAFVAVNLAFGSWYTVDAGEQAVVLRFGAVSRTAGPGLHFKLPFVEAVQTVQTRVTKHTTKSAAASKDLQVVHSEVALNYALSPDMVTAIYTRLGTTWENVIVEPTMKETFKAVTARYTAEELITKRETVRAQIESELGGKLASYGLMVKGVSITNFDFSPEFNASIEAKQTAEQNALKAQRDLERIKIEAEQKVASARAEAESIRIQKEQVTPMMLQLRAIEKWNGVMPQVTAGTVPFIQVPGGNK